MDPWCYVTVKDSIFLFYIFGPFVKISVLYIIISALHAVTTHAFGVLSHFDQIEGFFYDS